MSVPNQRIVQIGKRTVRDSNHLYATMNIDALQEAMRNLKWSGLKLWLYFNKNQEGYCFELSRQACDEWGIKKDSYYAGIKELQEKGYLVRAYEGGNLYTFYERPCSKKQNGAELNFGFTDETNRYSEEKKSSSEYSNYLSEKPYRNNIYNTDILQDNTAVDFRKGRKKTMRELGF